HPGPSRVQLSKGADLRRAHFRVAGDRRVFRKAAPLALAGGGNSLPNCQRAFARLITGELVKVDPLDLDVHINAVEDRSAQALLIAGDHRMSAATRPRRIAVEPARTRVSGRNQRELGRKRQRFTRAGDGDNAIFDRLAEDFQNARMKFGDLVEKEHSTMREADLAWSRSGPTTNQAGVADGVVRSAERSLANDRRVWRQH